MAHTISALRQHRQSEVRRDRNHGVRSALRTQLKKVLAAIEKKDATQSQDQYKQACKVLDRAVSKGVIHKNKAARHKSRLALKVNALPAEKK